MNKKGIIQLAVAIPALAIIILVIGALFLLGTGVFSFLFGSWGIVGMVLMLVGAYLIFGKPKNVKIGMILLLIGAGIILIKRFI